MRTWLAILCNIAVPGSGLILLQKEWLGVTLSLLFGLAATAGLWAVFITPASVPGWLAGASLTAAAVCWMGGQYVLRSRLRTFGDPAIAREVRALREQATQRAAWGDYEEAGNLLSVALALDDEDLETNVQLAELLTLLGRFEPARRAWLRVGRLDRRGAYRRHVAEALDQLPAR